MSTDTNGAVHDTAEGAAAAGTRRSRPSDIDQVIGDCAVYEDGKRRPGRVPFEQVREVTDGTNGFVWIGLRQPTAEDIAVLADELKLPRLAVEDAVKAHQRPKVEVYDDVLFVVLKPVRYVDPEEVVEVSEIEVFIGPKFVVTVRHGESDVLAKVRAELDQADSELISFGPLGVLYRAADLTVDGYEEAINGISTDIDDIEVRVFSDEEDDHARRIYKLKREVVEFRGAVLPLATPMEKLAVGKAPGVDKTLMPYFRDVHDHVLRASDAIEALDRVLSDVLQAHMSRLTVRQSEVAVRLSEVAARQNEDMRKISAWAAIALVPTAIAGIYGMNFQYLPELTWRYGYFIVLGVIAAVCAMLYLLFRRNGWL